jgi:hypothetical protein
MCSYLALSFVLMGYSSKDPHSWENKKYCIRVAPEFFFGWYVLFFSYYSWENKKTCIRVAPEFFFWYVLFFSYYSSTITRFLKFSPCLQEIST